MLSLREQPHIYRLTCSFAARWCNKYRNLVHWPRSWSASSRSLLFLANLGKEILVHFVIFSLTWASPMILSHEHHHWFSVMSITNDSQSWASPMFLSHEYHHWFSVMSITNDSQSWASPMILSHELHQWFSVMSITNDSQSWAWVLVNSYLSQLVP